MKDQNQIESRKVFPFALCTKNVDLFDNFLANLLILEKFSWGNVYFLKLGLVNNRTHKVMGLKNDKLMVQVVFYFIFSADAIKAKDSLQFSTVT